jgi:hypothetical protein
MLYYIRENGDYKKVSKKKYDEFKEQQEESTRKEQIEKQDNQEIIKKEDKKINSICDCLSSLGCENPFVVDKDGFPTDELTESGSSAYEDLREIIIFLESRGVVSSFNEDKLDELINESGY